MDRPDERRSVRSIAFDGGVTITENRGESWFRVQLPIAQMYHVTADNAIPYNVHGQSPGRTLAARALEHAYGGFRRTG